MVFVNLDQLCHFAVLHSFFTVLHRFNRIVKVNCKIEFSKEVINVSG